MQIVYTYKYLNNRQDIFMAALEEDNKYVDSLIELLGNEKIKASYEKHYFRKKFNGYTLKFEE